MRVTRKMIHPELRKTGTLIRIILPSFTEQIFRFAKIMIKPMKGKCRRRLQYEQQYISRKDGSLLRICIYSPLLPQKDVPGLLWIHGGGYALGTPEQDELFISRFIESSSCVVISPDYRLSVDAPYPAALDDCYAALLWLKEHGSEYGMRTDQIMIGGDSAGGGLTAAVSLYARDEKKVAIAFQMPLYPMLDDGMNTSSATNNDAPLWNSKSNYISWKLYLGDLFGSQDIPSYAVPARAKDYRLLPPTCSYVGSIEPFRDEAIAYYNQLRASDVPVHYKVFEGCFHGFDIVCANSSIAKEASAFLIDCFLYAVKHYFAEQSSGLSQ